MRSDLVSSSATSDKGKVSLGPLTPGTYYLFETEAPAGYVITDMPVRITVAENQVSLIQGARAQSDAIANEKAELMVMNSAGYELPNTGGSGTMPFYIFGVTLAGFAVACLVMRSRRKEA